MEQSRREEETRLSYTEIRAPVSGLVVDRVTEPGDTNSSGWVTLGIKPKRGLVDLTNDQRPRSAFSNLTTKSHLIFLRSPVF